jgi:hypothetical protein
MMQTDRYTKAVLTVIAAALVTLAGQNAIGSLHAADQGVQKVAICNVMTPEICATVKVKLGTGPIPENELITGQ